MEAFAQGALFFRVAQLGQQKANAIRPAAGLPDDRHGGGERGSAGVRVLQQLTFEGATLPGPVRVETAASIRA